MEVVVAVVAALAAGGLAGFFLRRAFSESRLTSAKAEADRILQAAERDGQSKAKEALVEAKEEIHGLRTDAEAEVKERRGEVQRAEERALRKEEQIDKRSETVDQREERLGDKENDIAETKFKLDEAHKNTLVELEKVAGLSSDEAKTVLLDELKDELKIESGKIIREHEAEVREESDRKARNILTLSIQRCASDHVAESTVTVSTSPAMI